MIGISTVHMSKMMRRFLLSKNKTKANKQKQNNNSKTWTYPVVSLVRSDGKSLWVCSKRGRLRQEDPSFSIILTDLVNLRPAKAT